MHIGSVLPPIVTEIMFCNQLKIVFCKKLESKLYRQYTFQYNLRNLTIHYTTQINQFPSV